MLIFLVFAGITDVTAGFSHGISLVMFVAGAVVTHKQLLKKRGSLSGDLNKMALMCYRV